jgi:hypothetical protein
MSFMEKKNDTSFNITQAVCFSNGRAHFVFSDKILPQAPSPPKVILYPTLKLKLL